MTISKKGILGAVVFIVAIVVLGGGYMMHKKKAMNSYAVIRMIDGATYVGHLVFTPKPKLYNPYVISSAPSEADPEQVEFALLPIGEGLWSPEVLILNPAQIISYSYASEGSDVYNVLEDAKN